MSDGKSKISISDEMVNRDMRRYILNIAKPYLTDYRVSFQGGLVYLSVKLQIKTLGPVTANYKLQVTDMEFNRNKHMIKASYKEDVRSNGSIAQSMMLKALELKGGTFLQTALEMIKSAGIRANSKSCSIDLEQLLDFNNVFISGLDLNYLDSREGNLHLSFNLEL